MSKTGAAHDPGGKSRPPWPKGSEIDPTFSECDRYRYSLSEIWDPRRPVIVWILMNPSTANVDYSDPTLRRTGQFSRDWGFGGQLIGNIFAYRATNKDDLLTVADPVGPENDAYLLELARPERTVMLGYGQPPGRLKSRGPEVLRLLSQHPRLHYLRLAKDGKTPWHPLYLPQDLRPIPYNFRED